MENRYRGRYPELAARRVVWREIVRRVQADAPGVESVLELGPGYGDFINQFPARRKLAYELNSEMARFASADVELVIGDACELAAVADASIDLVFASNFLEHLDAAAIGRLLPNVAPVLRPGGRLILLQPNYRRCPDVYFTIDDTHLTAFSDDDIGGWLAPHGLWISRLEPGLLPLTMKSRLPKWSILVRGYLASPVKPMGAQMYVVAVNGRRPGPP